MYMSLSHAYTHVPQQQRLTLPCYDSKRSKCLMCLNDICVTLTERVYGFCLMLADASRYFPCICAIFTCLVRYCRCCCCCCCCSSCFFFYRATLILSTQYSTVNSPTNAVVSPRTRSFAQWIVSIHPTHRQTILQTRLKWSCYTYRIALYVTTRDWIMRISTLLIHYWYFLSFQGQHITWFCIQSIVYAFVHIILQIFLWINFIQLIFLDNIENWLNSVVKNVIENNFDTMENSLE